MWLVKQFVEIVYFELMNDTENVGSNISDISETTLLTSQSDSIFEVLRWVVEELCLRSPVLQLYS